MLCDHIAPLCYVSPTLAFFLGRRFLLSHAHNERNKQGTDQGGLTNHRAYLPIVTVQKSA